MRTTLRTTLLVALLVVAGQVSVLLTGAWTWAWLTVPVLGLVAYLDLRVGVGALGTVTVISVAGGAVTPPDSWGLAVAVLLSAVAAVAVGRLARLAEIRESD
jgi:hypothetical protein